MNPYLEARWGSVHVLMMSALTAALNQSLPGGLEARPEEDVRVESLAGERLRSYRADVTVFEPAEISSPAESAGHAVVAEPVLIPYQHAPLIVRNVQIVDASDSDRVVTVIEVLSPWNKLAGKLNQKYIRKLHDFEASDVNWVEIDLLRSSRRKLIVTWADLPEEKRADYLVATYRADAETIVGYPIHLRDRLPVIKIPLRSAEESVPLDMKSVLDRVYSDGSFGSINYSKPLVPPLSPDDAKWAEGLILAYTQTRSASRRG